MGAHPGTGAKEPRGIEVRRRPPSATRVPPSTPRNGRGSSGGPGATWVRRRTPQPAPSPNRSRPWGTLPSLGPSGLYVHLSGARVSCQSGIGRGARRGADPGRNAGSGVGETDRRGRAFGRDRHHPGDDRRGGGAGPATVAVLCPIGNHADPGKKRAAVHDSCAGSAGRDVSEVASPLRSFGTYVLTNGSEGYKVQEVGRGHHRDGRGRRVGVEGSRGRQRPVAGLAAHAGHGGRGASLRSRRGPAVAGSRDRPCRDRGRFVEGGRGLARRRVLLSELPPALGGRRRGSVPDRKKRRVVVESRRVCPGGRVSFRGGEDL